MKWIKASQKTSPDGINVPCRKEEGEDYIYNNMLTDNDMVFIGDRDLMYNSRSPELRNYEWLDMSE